MNADTVPLGVKLVTLVSLRFKPAYTKGAQAWRMCWQKGFLPQSICSFIMDTGEQGTERL